MSSLEQMDALKQLQEVCLVLEEEADISKAMERAREGRFIPLGAMDEEASSFHRTCAKSRAGRLLLR